MIRSGGAARDTIKRSYETFDGPGVGPRQAARKEGTAGAGRELVGSEGPKLVERIKARGERADLVMNRVYGTGRIRSGRRGRSGEARKHTTCSRLR